MWVREEMEIVIERSRLVEKNENEFRLLEETIFLILFVRQMYVEKKVLCFLGMILFINNQES